MAVSKTNDRIFFGMSRKVFEVGVYKQVGLAEIRLLKECKALKEKVEGLAAVGLGPRYRVCRFGRVVKCARSLAPASRIPLPPRFEDGARTTERFSNVTN